MPTVRLTFEDQATTEDGFIVERSSTSEDGPWDVLVSLPANTDTGSVTCDDADVSGDTEYWYRVKAFNAAGESSYSNVAHVEVAPTPFDAADYPGCKAWFKPDVAVVGLTDGASAAAWPDSGPLNNDAAQTTSGSRPTYHTSGGPNDQPYFDFDGSNDFFEFGQITDLYTLYILVKHDSGSQSNPVLVGDSVYYHFQGRASTPLFAESVPFLANGQFFVNGKLTDLQQALKPTGYTLYSIVTSSPATVKYLLNDRNAYFWDGKVVEVILYSAVHTKAQRWAIEAYLADAARYDLTIEQQSQPPNSTNFLFAGNSILAAGNIQLYIKRTMNYTTVQTLTWAAGGRTTQFMASGAPTSEDAGYDLNGPFSEHVLIGWEITNDLADTDLGVTNTTAAAAAALTDIRNYYTARKAAHPALKVLAVTCLPRNNNFTNLSVTPADFETMRLAVNQGLRDNWESDGLDGIADVGGDSVIGAWFTNRVGYVKITNGGSGHSGNFAVSFSGGGGSGAAGVAIVSGGVVTGVAMTNNGTGYTSAPTASFAAGSGSGTAGTACLGASDITYIGDGTHPTTAGELLVAQIMNEAIGRLGLGS